MTNINLSEFIDDGYVMQQKIADACCMPSPSDTLSNEERYQLINNNLFHACEELIEARRELKRRPWKKDEDGFLDNDHKREAFIAEVFDVMLFLRASLAYAGISGEEFCLVANKKLKFNETRSDHKHV